MNWEEMSNFEINKAVLKISIPYEDICETEQIGGGQSVSWGDGYNLYIYNPCNSWADAGPIIQNNYLSIECDDMFDEPTPQSYWKAHNPRGNHYTDENPLRAAMIVFLMMQEPA